MGWLETLFGLRCPGCRQALDQHNLCRECDKSIHASFVSGFVFLGRYKDLGGISRAAKFRGQVKLLELLGKRLAEKVREENLEIDGVTFVPTFWHRVAARGHNPSEVLARTIARELGVPLEGVIKRGRYQKSQVKKTMTQRAKLPRDAFIPRAEISGYWLLVDDTVTTGKTFSVAMGAVRRAGADRIYGASIAIRSSKDLKGLTYNVGNAIEEF